MADPNCLSHWFPKLEAAGLPVPRTEIVRMPEGARLDAFRIVHGEPPETGKLPFFIEHLRSMADKIGFPCFLRTGHTSGKHRWRDTCFVEVPDRLERHVLMLVEESEMVGMMGLPYDVWAVRELLPTKPLATCPNYGGMPVNREFRYFVESEDVQCFHPYWPRAALEQGGLSVDDAARVAEELERVDRLDLVDSLACRAGEALGGAWSIDLLETERGWYITDCALAKDSWHWDGCPVAERSRRGEG